MPRQHYHLSPAKNIAPAELSKYLDEIGRRLATLESSHRLVGLSIPNSIGSTSNPVKGSNLLGGGSSGGGSGSSSGAGGSSVFNPGIVSAPLPVPGTTPVQTGQSSILISQPPLITADQIITGTNFRVLTNLNLGFSSISLPAAGTITQVGSVAVQINDVTFPILCGLNFQLNTNTSRVFGVHITDGNSGVYAAANVISGGQTTTEASAGFGNFAGFALPLASLGIGIHTIYFWLNTTDAAAAIVTGTVTTG